MRKPGRRKLNHDLPPYRRDLATLDALRPRLARLSKLSQRGDDTQRAVGSDLMTSALEGYAVLKVTGKWQGVDDLRKMLATRFARLRCPSPRPNPRPPDRQRLPAASRGKPRMAAFFFCTRQAA